MRKDIFTVVVRVFLPSEDKAVLLKGGREASQEKEKGTAEEEEWVSQRKPGNWEAEVSPGGGENLFLGSTAP